MTFTLNPQSALEQHFVKQETDASCSLASLTTVLNAILKFEGREGYTQQQFLEKINDPFWTRSVADDGDGISRLTFKKILEKGVDVLPLKNIVVEEFEMNPIFGDQRLLADLNLMATEINPSFFLIAHFDISHYLTDEAPEGHFSPVGGFDPFFKRVLILDTAKAIPLYSVSFPTFLSGLQTKDSSKKTYRGYIKVTLKNRKKPN